MTDESIPCPFCGSTDIETFYNKTGVDHLTCQYCGATAKDWNTRHESGELPEWLKEAIENEILGNIVIGSKYNGTRYAVHDSKIKALQWVLSLRKPENK